MNGTNLKMIEKFHYICIKNKAMDGKDSNLANISNITYYLHYTNDFGPQQCFYRTRDELNSAIMKVKGTDIWIEINVIVNGCTPIEKVTVTQELTKNQ